MNKKASKRDSIPKTTHVERLNVARVDAKDAHIRARGTRPKLKTQNSPKTNDLTMPHILKDKSSFTKLKL